MINQAKRQVRSYRYAAKGVKYTLATQVNIWVHIVSSVLVLVLAWVLDIPVEQILILIMVIGLVISAELLNTALEIMTDWVSPEYNDKAAAVKDVAAGGVLAAAITATVVGLVIFGPPLLNLLTG